MTRNIEKISVLAGGAEYTEWESVEVSYALKSAARDFVLRGTERPGQFRFPPGTPIAILANGFLLLNGYVNRYVPEGDAQQHVVTISGRSKSQDFIDSGVIHPTSFFENKTPDQIGQELDRFGVGVTAEVPLQKIPYWQVTQGESPWRTVERALRPQGASQMGKADGSIAITNATVATPHAGALVEGHNILQFRGEITDDNRHSEYVVKGQGRLGHGVPAIQPVGNMRDLGVGRYRPKVIINEGDTDTARAQRRAEHELNRRAGYSVKATIATQGWRDDAGKVWEANSLIFVQSPILLKLVQMMLIESVRLHQDSDQGSIATLDLVDPRAYGGEGGGAGGGDSDPAWA